jgi:hypothetical protein
MAKPNKPRPVAGRAGLSKAQAEATKRIKAMTPAQRKAYQSQNKKNAVKVAATAASMIPAGRAAVVGGKAAAKAIAYKKFQKELRNQIVKGAGNKGEREIVNQMAKSWEKTLKNTNTKFIGGNRKRAYELAAKEYEFNSPKIGQALKSKGPKTSKDVAKMKKALINNVNSKNLKGKIGKTPASQPSRPIDRNIAKHSALRKKYPEKFNPSKKK